jgi:hypothetical protein
MTNQKQFGEIDKDIKQYLLNTINKYDDNHIQDDFDSYCHAQDKAEEIFKNPIEFSKRTITTLANCGELSCDKSVVTLC